MFELQRKQKKLNKKYHGKVRIQKEEGLLRLTGQCSSWKEAVEAGLLVAKSGSKIHIVNDIEVLEEPKENPLGALPKLKDSFLQGREPDVLIIGGGVIGCAIARELTKHKLDILLIEKEYDVAVHSSSRNDGMVHPGIDLLPGFLKKKYNHKGNALFDQLTADLEVPFQRVGQYLCFRHSWMKPLARASFLYFNPSVSGKVHYVGKEELRRLEPGISEEAEFALYFDGAGIVCPFNLTIALAENAIENGAEISLNTAALSMKLSSGEKKGILCVETNRGKIYPKLVINAAGVFSEEIARMAGDRFFSIHPRKGTSAILDKKAKSHIHSVYSLIGARNKKNHSKGGGIVSTVHGNVLVGPDAVEVREKEDYSTHRENLQAVLEKHRSSSNWLSPSETIAYFSGIRAATYEEDFILEPGRKTVNLLHAAGIQSPGLTAAPAIALEMERLSLAYLKKIIKVEKNPHFNPKRKAILHVAELSKEERNKLIQEDPNYGQILCRCEEISKGEILDAMRRPLPCTSLDGIKRRVRPTSGRCQGGFCGPLVLQLIAKEQGIALHEVDKGYPGSPILCEEKGVHHEKL